MRGVANNDLGRILRERRQARGLTLKKVSDLAAIHPSHLLRIENGQRVPGARALKRLAGPLGFSEVELFKQAGFLSRDDTDVMLDNFKRELKREIAHTLVNLYKRVDCL